jgi:hypothetical protein
MRPLLWSPMGRVLLGHHTCQWNMRIVIRGSTLPRRFLLRGSVSLVTGLDAGTIRWRSNAGSPAWATRAFRRRSDHSPKTGILHRTRAEKVDNYRALAAIDEGKAFPAVSALLLKELPLLT